MNKQFPAVDLTEWLGPDASKIWATSFTVDEHEAFALFYRALGGKVPTNGVCLSYHRRALRRAGQGVIPRKWLRPFDVPFESPLPTYHPKLMLVESGDRYRLVLSTANLAGDDLRRTRNLAVSFAVSTLIKERVADWIKQPPKNHRALCVLVDDDGSGRILPFGKNRSTFEQIATCLDRCKRCRSTGERQGEWLVAAPFWSPATIKRLLKYERDGQIEAYFRTRTIWHQMAAALQRDPRVTAYELTDGGELPRWHHKVLGWRCCPRPGARSALYLGSANATVCGLVGSNGRAINWEAGALWLGGQDLWEHARNVARAGFSATKLSWPRVNSSPKPEADDELGPIDFEELQRVFATYTSQCISVNPQLRQVSRSKFSAKSFRALGRSWRLASLDVGVERRKRITDHGRLNSGVCVIPPDGRAWVRAVYRDVSDERFDAAEVTIDLTELDPDPPPLPVTTRSSIAAALVGLMGSAWVSNGTGAAERSLSDTIAMPSDVRFPFSDFFALQRLRPTAATVWLDRIAKLDEPALEKLPEYWRRIAKALREDL